MNKDMVVETEAETTGRIRKRTVWICVALSLVGTGVVSLALAGRGGAGKNPSAATTPAGPGDVITLAPEQRASVVTASVKVSDLPVRIAVPAKVDFNENRITPLFAQFAGRVTRLDAEAGMSVREGQVLATLDSPDIVGAQSDHQRAQADYQQALANERTARASLDLAIRTRERAAKLASVEAIPEREFQEAQAAEDRMKDDLARAQASVAAAQSAAAAARGRLQIAGFANEEIARLDKGGPGAITRSVAITAPVGGTIVERKVGLGQLVQPGGDALFKIADLSTVWVNADVYEDQLARIRSGAEVAIQTSAYPGETFSARVDRIASVVDMEKRTIAVRCIVPNGDGRLKPGMFATVELHSGNVQRALVAPASAIVATGSRRTAFVEQGSGIFQERAVDIGDEIDGSVVVRSGLREGDRVVVRGGLLLSQQLAEARSSR